MTADGIAANRQRLHLSTALRLDDVEGSCCYCEAVTTDLMRDPLKLYDVYTSMAAGDPPQPWESNLELVTPFDGPCSS